MGREAAPPKARDTDRDRLLGDEYPLMAMDRRTRPSRVFGQPSWSVVGLEMRLERGWRADEAEALLHEH